MRIPQKSAQPEKVMQVRYQTTLGTVVKKLVKVLTPMLFQANLRFDSTGLHIQGMTSSVIVCAHLPPSTTESYTFGSSAEVIVGVDLKILSGWLDAVAPGDIISFDVQKAEGSKDYTLTYKHWNVPFSHEVEIPVLKIPILDAKSPSQDFTSMGVVDSRFFNQVLERHGTNSEWFCLGTIGDDNRWAITSDGTGRSNSIIYVRPLPALCNNISDWVLKKTSSKGGVMKTPKYPISVLRSLCKTSSLGDTVMIGLSENAPLVLSYPITQMGSVEYRVAAYDPNTEDHASKKKARFIKPSSPETKRKRSTPPSQKNAHRLVKRRKKKQMTETKAAVSPIPAPTRPPSPVDMKQREQEKEIRMQKFMERVENFKKKVKEQQQKEGATECKHPPTQCSQKCMMCTKFLLAGEETVELNGEVVHEDCVPPSEEETMTEGEDEEVDIEEAT